MKISTRTTLIGLALSNCVALPAIAQESQWGVGITGGTLGAGPQVTYRFNPRWGLRSNAGFLSLSRDTEIDDIDYDGSAQLRSLGAMFDWYPTAGGLRLSLGGRLNQTHIDLTGAPTSSVTVGDTTYAPQQVGTLAGAVKLDKFAPTLSIGYGGTLGQGFSVGAEIGVMWQGAPRIENLHATGPFALTPQLQADLNREEQRIEDKLDNYQLWPIAQLEFQYRF